MNVPSRELTPEDIRVILLAAGTPNQQLASELVVALETVNKHVSQILGKLGAANRTEALARARRWACFGSEIALPSYLLGGSNRGMTGMTPGQRFHPVSTP